MTGPAAISPLRDPASVPCRYITDAAHLSLLAAALATAERVAIDTETPIDGPAAGTLRVMSVAVRSAEGCEQSFVVDTRDVDPTLLAPLLTGVEADGWNAAFDANVLDRAVWGSADTTPHLRWWDCQLADAVLHQGSSGFTWYHGLAWAAERYLGVALDGKGSIQVSFTATGNLSADQVRYAATDAVVTLWVGDALRAELAAADLEQIAAIENEARPFLDRMMRTGLPFDWAGWQTELRSIERANRAVLGTLSALTGGGQGTLFDDVTEPSWNPASDRQVKEALNRWSRAEVERFTRERYGAPRPLTDGDSVSAPVLRDIGGPLCEAILEFRNHAKILSTYGESIHEHLWPDGRLHPQYLQVVGTNTGRLASRNPNAQNFTPRMLPFVRPPEAERVFVHADLSQAELRVLAQVAADEPLRAAFRRGDDVHVSTAGSMFGVDAAELRSADPDRFARLRRIAKALNFGIAYGTGAAALSRTLTAEGTLTTVEDAGELLARYRATYPGTAAWAEARITEIDAVAATTDTIDWRATMRLARGHGEVTQIRRDFRKGVGRWPAVDEIVAVHPLRMEMDEAVLADQVTWLLGYAAPVALVAGGAPFTFASRTMAGRRQQFNLHLDRLFLSVVHEAVRSTDPALVQVRRRFAREHGLTLDGLDTDGASGGGTARLDRQFEDRPLRRAFVEAIAAELGKEAADAHLGRAARERVGAMVNAWRNAPIQGAVADIMLVAYADLHRRLARFPSARPVQTVHDSVVIECDRAEAEAVAAEVRSALEEASLRFCPDVVPRADVDIRTTLADDSLITP
ncbi:MAG: DNA polymerase [Acidimicrobiia bacterium]|nr:DNA polymerase [Acidimicrobiia bacterium]MDH5288753.1 DNA polymerase [Acidimicrobiia bacterium]